MSVYVCLLLALLAQDKPAAGASAKAVEKLNAISLEEAAKWRMNLDQSGRERAELVRKPIYIWTNPLRSNGQHGSVFVWVHEGRPTVVGSIFSYPQEGRRVIMHEFHSLATDKLIPEREPTDQAWVPGASIHLLPVPGAPVPESSPARRLIQMRTISREFTAHSVDNMKERWELRMLAQPMYRYESPTGDIIDGALFAFVTSAGTDPEVVLVLEASRMENTTSWNYRAIRFSDSDLFVRHKGKEVWTSIRDDRNQLFFNPDHTYQLIKDKVIDELPELESVK